LDSVVPINVNTRYKLLAPYYLLEDHYTSEKPDVNVHTCRTINVLRTSKLLHLKDIIFHRIVNYAKEFPPS